MHLLRCFSLVFIMSVSVVGAAAECFHCVVAYDFEDPLAATEAKDKSGLNPSMPGILQPGAQLVDDAERGRVLLTSSDGYGTNAEHTAKLDFTTSFTLAAWVKVEEGSGEAWQRLVSQGGGGPRLFEHWGLGALGAMHLTEGDTWAPANFGPGPDPGGSADGGWHHILMTWDQATGLLAGYYDGVLEERIDEFNRRVHPVQRSGSEKAIHPTEGFAVGGGMSEGELANPLPDAYIDDAAYWTASATAEIVQGLFNGSLTIFNAFDSDPISGHPCDFNGNNTVDFGDFVMFSNVFGQTAEEAGAQFDKNENGTVDFGDFVTFSNSFGQTVDDLSAVPEPASQILLGIALMFFSIRVNDRRPRQSR